MHNRNLLWLGPRKIKFCHEHITLKTSTEILLPASWQPCGMLAQLTANILMRLYSSSYLILTVIFLLTRIPCRWSRLLLIWRSRRWPRRSAISRTCRVARGLSRPHVSIVRVLCRTLLHAWRWLVGSSTLIVPTSQKGISTLSHGLQKASDIITSPLSEDFYVQIYKYTKTL